ncbi:conserved oligomeric Golgi complex subunit 6-like [Sphaeramia orbicularis]|uniref:conserved oligomeric Golgi complex subunit 6-like n=1 Tax=Sphaeramia orbicularis TaxID=375764 RepID=UPI001180575B|nr:conserved oligomeric Golgi complex subunit 6-like [Sphaeramia orbicularis]
MATYMVNSLYVMKTTLALFEFTDKRLEMLEFQIEAHLDTLINEQASYVLTRAGLSYIYSCVQQHSTEQGPLSLLPSMDSSSVKAAMVQFDRYLSSPDTLVMPQLNFLLSAAIKEQIFRQSTELVCRAYGEVYSALSSPTNGYKDPETWYPDHLSRFRPYCPEKKKNAKTDAPRGRTAESDILLFKELCNLYSVIT